MSRRYQDGGIVFPSPTPTPEAPPAPAPAVVPPSSPSQVEPGSPITGAPAPNLGQTIGGAQITQYGYPGDKDWDRNSGLAIGDRGNQLSPQLSVALTQSQRKQMFPDAQINPKTGLTKSTGNTFQWGDQVYRDDDNAPEPDKRIDVFNPTYSGIDKGVSTGQVQSRLQVMGYQRGGPVVGFDQGGQVQSPDGAQPDSGQQIGQQNAAAANVTTPQGPRSPESAATPGYAVPTGQEQGSSGFGQGGPPAAPGSTRNPLSTTLWSPHVITSGDPGRQPYSFFGDNNKPPEPSDAFVYGKNTNDLNNYLFTDSSVNPARAAAMIKARAQDDNQNQSADDKQLVLSNDVGNALKSLVLDTPAAGAKGLWDAPGNLLNGVKEIGQSLGGFEDNILQSIGGQSTADYDQEMKAKVANGTWTQDQYNQAKAKLDQIDQIRNNRAIQGSGALGGYDNSLYGTGSPTAATDSQVDMQQEQAKISSLFFQADPDFAAHQAAKASQEILGSLQLNGDRLKALGNAITNVTKPGNFDWGKYFTGKSVFADMDVNDIQKLVEAKRAAAQQVQNEHAQGQNLDPTLSAFLKWRTNFGRDSGLLPSYAQWASPEQLAREGNPIDPAKVRQMEGLYEDAQSALFAENPIIKATTEGLATAGLKTAGWTAGTVVPAVAGRLNVFSRSGRFGAIPMILDGINTFFHGGNMAMEPWLWSVARDTALEGGAIAAQKFGPAAGQIFENAAENNYRGGGLFSQLAGRGTRLTADALAKSLPYAVATSGGDPEDFLRNYSSLVPLHLLGGLPETGLQSAAGATGDYLFARDGKVPPKAPITYGVDGPLDAENVANINSLPDNQKNLAATAQHWLQGNTDVYYVNKPTLQDYLNRFGSNAQVTPRGVFIEPRLTGTGRAAAFIDMNHIDDAMPHEVIGHSLYWMLDKSQQAEIADNTLKYNDPNKFIRDNYGSKATYDTLPDQPDPANPGGLSKDMIREEMAVEEIGRYFNGASVSQFYKDKPGLNRSLRMGAGKILEKIGLPTSTFESTSAMGINPTFARAELFDGYMRQLAKNSLTKPPVDPTWPKTWPGVGEVRGGGNVPPPPNPNVPNAPPPNVPNVPPTEENIAKRAYEISQTRQATNTPGDHVSDWLQAEHELKTGAAQAPETGPEAQRPDTPSADTDQHHAQVEELINKGVPAGEAQAAVEGRPPKTIADDSAGPKAMPAGVKPVWQPGAGLGSKVAAALSPAMVTGTEERARQEPPPAPVPRATWVAPAAATPTPTPTAEQPAAKTGGYTFKEFRPSAEPTPAPAKTGGYTFQEYRTPDQKPKVTEPTVTKEQASAAPDPALDQLLKAPRSDLNDDLLKGLIAGRLNTNKLDDPRVVAEFNRLRGGGAPTAQQQPAAQQQPEVQKSDAEKTAESHGKVVGVTGTEFGAVDNPIYGVQVPNWNKGAWNADISSKTEPGVALPEAILRHLPIPITAQNHGKYGDIFNGNYVVRITNPKTGKVVEAPLKDLGPGTGTGALIDMMWKTREDLGLPVNFKGGVSYEIVDKNSGKVAYTPTGNEVAEGGGGKLGAGGRGGGRGKDGISPDLAPVGQATPFQPPPQTPEQPEYQAPVQSMEEAERMGAATGGGGGGYYDEPATRMAQFAQMPAQMPAAHVPSQAEMALQYAQQSAAFGGAPPMEVNRPLSLQAGAPAAPGETYGGAGMKFMPARRGAAPEEEEPPEGSTLGKGRVKGFSQMTPLLNENTYDSLRQAQEIHGNALSEDDTRVRKQGDQFKGEHFVEKDPLHRAMLSDLPTNWKVALAAGQHAMSNNQPMHASYLSAPPEAAKESPLTRQSREVNYDASSPQARIMGRTNMRLAGDSFIPTGIGIGKNRAKGLLNPETGQPQKFNGYIQGISTSVAAHNHSKLNDALGDMGQESPYPKLGSPKFRNDLTGYVQNLMAGHKGTGAGYQPSTEQYPVSPNKAYVPYRLKQHEADFLNAVVNNQRARHSESLRELAKEGHTLLTEKGEVNPLRHAIDQHYGGDEKDRWSKKILEPTIRTYNTALIHALHANAESIPQEIRPQLPGYKELTKTLGRELALGPKKGWPDIPTGAHFMPGKGHVPEPPEPEPVPEPPEPHRYKPPPLSREEHEELTSNIRKQLLSGKLKPQEYLDRLKDVPEPGEALEGIHYMPMAGPRARGFAKAEQEGRTYETPLPGGGKRFEIDDRDPNLRFKPDTTGQGRNALEKRFLSPVRGNVNLPLDKAIEHPELFENYPWLRNTKIHMDEGLPETQGGYYEHPWLDKDGNPRGDQIVIKDPTDKETLVHEIQHAIQHYEDFAGKGTNPSSLTSDMARDPNLRGQLVQQFNAKHPTFAANLRGAAETGQETPESRVADKARTMWMNRRLGDMGYAMYMMNPGEIEARVAGKRAMQLPEGQEPVLGGPSRRYVSAEQQTRSEMRLAAGEGRQAGLLSEMPGVHYMPPKLEKPSNWKEQPEDVRQAYLEEKVKRTLANQYRGPETHELEVDRNANGGIKYDPSGKPVYKKRDYDLANAPGLGDKALGKLGLSDLAKEQVDTIDPNQHKHLNDAERRRLSAMRAASAVSTAASAIADSYMKVKDIPEIAAGKGWYSNMRKKLSKVLKGYFDGTEHEGKDAHELFAQLLGATSAKTPVQSNFIQALDALEQFKSGAFNRHREKYLEAYNKLQEGGKDALVAHMKANGIPLYAVNDAGDKVEDVLDHKTDAAAMANWIHHHDILPRQKQTPEQLRKGELGSKYNANSMAVLRAIAGTWLDEIGAPKTPNFAGNLSGRTKEATIDVWAARHLQRILTENHTDAPWRAQAQAEPGVNGLDFAFAQDAMRHAADEIGRRTGKKMNPDDLQAILWYAEKHHYEDQGWTRGAGAKKASFDDVADLAFPKTGQGMTSEELRSHYQALAKAKAQRNDKIKLAKEYVKAEKWHDLGKYVMKHQLSEDEVFGEEPEEEEGEEEAA